MTITPILAEHLAEVGRFLHENLNRRFTAEQWVNSVAHRWAESPPNHGMQLRDGERLVGVFLAIYSDQIIGGRIERICNPHSWCVLESHRKHGIGLLLNLVKQQGYHFTMFTPNPKVAQVFLGLKFRNLDDRLFVCFNLPALAAWRRDAFVETEPGRIAGLLHGQDRNDFEAHRGIPWLKFVAFGARNEVCWVIFKPSRWKRLPCANILHIGNAEVFSRLNGILRNHLLHRHHFATLKIEGRWLAAKPAWSVSERRTQPKLIKSATLVDGEVRDLYSELMSLDV